MDFKAMGATLWALLIIYTGWKFPSTPARYPEPGVPVAHVVWGGFTTPTLGPINDSLNGPLALAPSTLTWEAMGAKMNH